MPYKFNPLSRQFIPQQGGIGGRNLDSIAPIEQQAITWDGTKYKHNFVSDVVINVLNYIPRELISAIQNRTGLTDLSTYINDAILAAASTNARTRTVFIPDGLYTIQKPIVLKRNVSLLLSDNAEIKARTGFSGAEITGIGGTGITFNRNAMIKSDTNIASVGVGGYWENSFIRGGIINGNNIADIGIELFRARFVRISNVFVTKCMDIGIYAAPVGAVSTSYELEIHNVRIFHDDIPNRLASRGMHLDNVTDTYVSNCYVIGYQTGFRSDGASIDWHSCHAWNRPIHGPLIHCFYCNGANDSYVQCYADTPTRQGLTSITEVYGFYLNRYNQRLISCRSFISSTYGADNEAVGVYVSSTGNYSTIFGHFTTTDSASVRWRADFDGPGLSVETTTLANLTDFSRVLEGNAGINRIQGSLKANKGFITSVINRTTNYTVSINDTNFTADATANNINFTLPKASGVVGKAYYFKRKDGSAYNVIITPASGDAIDGAATFSLSKQFDYVGIVSDGLGWLVVAKAAHTHTTAAISDFSEGVQDEVASLLVAGTGITLQYNDTANTLTINSSGGGGQDATSTAKGIIQLAGDLTGTASSPTLANTSVVAGNYSSPSIAVDSKGRITSATNNFVPSASQTITSSSTINPNAAVVQISASAVTTITATPSISTTGVSDGQPLRLINVGNSTITLRDNSSLAGTALRLGGQNYTLSSGTYIDLVYSSTLSSWVFGNRNVLSGLTIGPGTKTSNFTFTVSEAMLFVDCTSGAITGTLSSASGNSGRIVKIIKTDSSANTCTLVPQGGQTINGAANYVLSTQYQFVELSSNNTNWFVVGKG